MLKPCPHCWLIFEYRKGPVSCKNCSRLKLNARKAKWCADNPDKRKAICKRTEEKHKAKRKIKNINWRKANPNYQSQWLSKNKEKRQLILQRFFENNPGYGAFQRAKYRKAAARAIPIWANLENIKQFYKKAAIAGLTVDHIIPLQGKLVCGLHVESNLQQLTQSQNSHKNNRFWPDMF